MKDKLTPQEKKRLSYKKDHRTRTGEPERAMRKTWKKRKARVNRKYRRKADAALHKAISPEQIDALMAGDDPTTRELIRKGLTRENNSRKWGVSSLKEALSELREKRDFSIGRKPKQTARMIQFYKNMVTAFEKKPESFGAYEIRALIEVLRRDELKDFAQENPVSLILLNKRLHELLKKERAAARKEEEKRKWRSPSLRLPRNPNSEEKAEQ